MVEQSIYAFVFSFAFVAVLGDPFIKWLTKKSVGQTVREEGPKSHYVKSGTPTFGGILFTIPLLVASVLLAFVILEPDSWSIAALNNPVALVIGLYILGNAAVGYADDYVKVRISKKGLSAVQKTIPMLLIIALFVLYYLFLMPGGPVLYLPFVEKIIPIVGWWKLPYGVLAFLFLYYIGNSVNFTDGVDGLLSTVTVPVLMLLAALAALIVKDEHGLILLYSVLIGGLLAFLLFNKYPARIFMGDTGSLAIGALIAGGTLYMGIPWVLLFAGVIYWVESLTVMIQVTYFKKTGGKRIFKMTPIHHHFELSGWAETKIVFVFTAVTILGCLISLLTLYPYLR